ncbi:MAG: hypothetical protein ACXADL_08115 [Candidatus Thorarchaeota archaeon]|jgi:hypothetical protein
MKPLGTITMYNQFIDKETASQVDTIMNQADNYYDFVLRLSEKACLDESPPPLAHLAAVHAWRLSATQAKNILLEKFSEDPLIKSWASPQHKIGFENIVACIDEAINLAKEDWVRIELLCLKTWYARYNMGNDTLWYDPLESAENILQQHSNLECFAALVHTVRSELSFMDRFYDPAYDSQNIGMEYAKKYNDQFQIYQLLWTRASWIKTWDARKALELQEEAYKLAKKFGAPQKIAEAMADMGRISEGLGEYDLALECYQSSVETYGSPEMELYRELIDSPSFCISRVYCELGDGQSGLNWIDSLINLVGSSADEHPYLYAQRGEALVLLNRFQEAAQQLEISQKLSLKSGDEGFMNLCELPTAYLEMARGDPYTAIKTLEPGFEYLSQGPAAIYINRFLIALTRAEIATNLEDTNNEVSEQWLSKLGRHAREKKLPGIIMLHALLKTEYLLAQDLRKEAVDTLKDALMEEHSETAITLYQRVQNKLKEL